MSEQKILYVGGGLRPFRCESCGANVFTQISPLKYKCNGCHHVYIGVVEDEEKIP